MDDDEVSEFLEHFGVKGMQWGRRKDRATGTSKKTSKEARKDAEESARAKMFYGKGAGTRRKLIKNTVESKAKRDPEYAKAYQHHLSKQDMGTHASKARSERSRKDKKEVTSKTAKATIRKITGEPGTQAAFVAGAFAGAAYLNSPAGRVKMQKGYSKLQKGAEQIMRKKGAMKINQMLKGMQ